MHTFIRLKLKDLKDWDEKYRIPDGFYDLDVYLIGMYVNLNAPITDYKDALKNFRILCYAKQLHIAIEIVRRLNGGNNNDSRCIAYPTLRSLMKSYIGNKIYLKQ